jgi:hypothetical protein
VSICGVQGKSCSISSADRSNVNEAAQDDGINHIVDARVLV